ncbi:hypothetical protein BEWA_038420 [Theileria equi strain WA]|uniref:Uncharacterized protein n=1 Tax=Theileria equi strain WA TaxID=1537102 RepID=L1LEZ9_THEEQ|nr:hypothetical protein BEWA_038420 [Theileria equi strain WA]EKX73805.1 hypothetical protein BEWA_038420 [Theileria equi strain WA]|eukprot:XP_004833257.1 hypothetical protein BEWA_038420 [Theileria equi strain WA]
MINFVPSSIAWPSKKLLPCKKKRSHKCMFYEPEKARINHGCDNSVCLCLALDRNADGPIGVAPVKQPGFIIKYPLYKESQHNGTVIVA